VDYGRTAFGATGVPIEVAASGPPEWMPVGITIAWATVAAVGADTVTSPAEGLTVKSGQKYLRYGQVLCRINDAQAYTVTETGVPTGGTFTLTGTRPDTGGYAETAAIAQAATAATVLAALQTTFPGLVHAVTGSAGGPYTITSPVIGLALGTNALTGGTAPSVTSVVATASGDSGKYGPYDFAATDGRQTLTPGQCCILNTTTLQSGILVTFSKLATDHPGVLIGGYVWLNRIIATGGTHSLAAGPTQAELRAAFPRLIPVDAPPIR
jgi:hypothetical protein